MAKIRPFCAIHPADGLWQRIAALPYDVYSRKEAREEAAKDPLSFLNIDRPETQFPEDCDMYAPKVYDKARELLEERIREGSFVRDETASYYLYELTMEGRSQTGFVGCASIDDYLNGVIRRHELTREEKELDRIRHVDTVNAQTGPILLAYRQSGSLREISARIREQAALFDFVSSDGVRHRGWRVSGKDAEMIRDAFRSVGQVYIADGHHRAASAVKVGLKRREQNPGYSGEEPFNYFLSVLFPDDELMIMDYNRVVKDLNGLSPEAFLKKLEEKCEIKDVRFSPLRPASKGEFSLYLAGNWFRMSFRPALRSSDPVEGLDVSILQREILGPILGIADPRTDERIDFVGGIRGYAELIERCGEDCKAAFAMYPTSIEELFAVADAGLLMPPKSTWFEPKLRSGLFLHALD